jgi:anti-sigma B factor antagonist
MALEIKQREREGIAILDLRGRITVGEEAGVLRDAFSGLPGAANVILNLRDVESIDSTGLGALVLGFTSLRKRGGRLKLENLNRRNIELLVFTKLTTVFEIFNDEQDAVNSFFPDRAIKRFDILSFVKEQVEQDGL